MLSFTFLPQNLEELLNLSRYSHIPICNLSGDKLNLVNDVFFQRMVKSANMISWYSNSLNCDLGGAEEDDFRDLIQRESLSSDISNPNFYDTYTVEIEISMFAINSICSLDELRNIDKEASKLDTRSITTDGFENLDDFYKSRDVFKLLKVMANGWIEDVLKDQNRYADLLIQNLHRWICQENCKMYDKVVARVLRRLMQKFLIHLVKKLKALRATIVYASTSKLLICTHKR